MDLEFWKEFFAALYPKHYYVNIKSPLPLIDLNFILIGIYVGVVIALFGVWYRRGYMGRAVRAILKCEALSEASAKTAAQLGLAKKRLILRGLRKKSFGSLVKTVTGGADGVVSTEVRYYIEDSRKYEAEDRYSRRGIGLGAVIIWAILLIPIFMVIRFIVPELLQMLDNYITSVK